MRTLLRHAAVSALALSLIEGVSFAQHYTQTNLAASTPGMAAQTDPYLVNSWGLARSSSSPWWIANERTGGSSIYSGAGVEVAPAVAIPAATTGNQGTPTGAVYNGVHTAFAIAPGVPAPFLFATIDGTIAGWNPTMGTRTLVKTTDGSSYTGLTIARAGTGEQGPLRLYAANFTLGRIDVYNSALQHLPMSDEQFMDPQLPANYVPFNVQTIGKNIVVAYALHEPGNQFETDGPGRGYVDIYSSMGTLLARLDHGEFLNAPWGVALAPNDFGAFSHALLVGQWAGGGSSESSGTIAAFDLTTGHFLGQLRSSSGEGEGPLAINGLWAISFGNAAPNNSNPASAPAAELYFTAGPEHGSNGLFGYLTPLASELTQGNDQ